MSHEQYVSTSEITALMKVFSVAIARLIYEKNNGLSQDEIVEIAAQIRREFANADLIIPQTIVEKYNMIRHREIEKKRYYLQQQIARNRALGRYRPNTKEGK